MENKIIYCIPGALVQGHAAAALGEAQGPFHLPLLALRHLRALHHHHPLPTTDILVKVVWWMFGGLDFEDGIN